VLQVSWRVAALFAAIVTLSTAYSTASRANAADRSTSAPAGAAATVSPVPDTEWAAMVAAGVWHAGCPAGQDQLRRVAVNFRGFDGAVHRGALVVRADTASSAARIFTRLFEAGFPIRSMVPIEAYNGDDNASMAADNTSAFNCRRASQANAPVGSSPHANGRAIDVNPYENPWVDPRCNCFRPDAKYAGDAKQPRSGPGVITKGSAAWRIFIAEGWIWQDNSTPDYQHFDTGYPSRPFGATKTALPLKSQIEPLPFAVPVSVGNANQIITVKAFGNRATVTAWTKESSGWRAAFSTTSGRIGAKGIASGSTRRQNTNTTPSGTYTVTQAFGILANPGTALPYHVVTKDDWWVEDNNSPYYNTMRTALQGGFDIAAPESSVNGSERLITHTPLYNYALVINFNMSPSAPYRGAGIFLHVLNGNPTAGCVAVPAKTMVALLRWLSPAAHPRIAIG